MMSRCRAVFTDMPLDKSCDENIAPTNRAGTNVTGDVIDFTYFNRLDISIFAVRWYKANITYQSDNNRRV